MWRIEDDTYKYADRLSFNFLEFYVRSVPKQKLEDDL